MKVKGKTSKILKSGLAATFAFSLIATNPSQILAFSNTGEDQQSVTASIYPKPQNVSYISETGMTLEGEVNVVLHGDQDDATLPALEKILKANGITYVIGNEIDDTKANILVTSSKDHCDDCKNDDASLNKKEGYVLTASDDQNSKGEITIVGSDIDGAYYGVVTLGQILDQSIDDKFAEIVVSDYPEIEFRGFIEGFYGIPWSHEDRMNLMRDTSKYKMNTYIYAPKDDPYHRNQWRELYPEDKASEIAELAKAGKENNFNFCWTIHPGDHINLYSEDDFKAALNKLEQLYSLGVRQFGVLFDDISNNQNGTAQANFINRIDDEFVKVKGDVKPLITVGTRYCAAWGPSMTGYLKPFVETLHDDVEVMWTGSGTMSNVSKSIYDWPKQQIGTDKDFAVWWNYPVNDYCDGKLLMGPMDSLVPDLDNVNSFFSNPMNQAEASKVALYGIADYTWNTDAYDYMSSWKRAIKELVPEVNEEFERFASNISYLNDGIKMDESAYLDDKVDALKAALISGENIKDTAKALLGEFDLILTDCDKLENVGNEALQKEIEPFLGAYRELAKAGVNSMQALIAIEDGDSALALSYTSAAQEAYDAMSKYTVHRLEDAGERDYVVDVGTHSLKPIIKTAIDKSNENIGNLLFPQTTAQMISNVKNIENKEVTLSNGNFLLEDVGITLDNNQYVGVVLPEAKRISEISVSGTNLENLDLEYSINGIEWQKAEVTKDSGISMTSKISATYVRLINNNSKVDVNINTLQINPIYAVDPTASTNMGTYENYKISNIIDGNKETKFWNNANPSIGQYIQIDFGTMMPLYDLTAYFASGDYIKNGNVQISTDGEVWTDLGVLDYEDVGATKVSKLNANGQEVRYVRYVVTGSQSTWVQLFEVEYNQTVGDVGDHIVKLTDSNTDGVHSNVGDKDLTTAFAPTTIKDGDYLTYQMSRINNVGDLIIIQDPKNISEAKVSVKNLDGNWREVGVLDKQVVTLAVNSKITEVKVDFDSAKPLPVIYEIVATQRNVVEEVDKTALKIALDKANEITAEDLENVVPVVVEEFKAALQEANDVYANASATQEQVNNAFDRLASAMQKLEFFKGDKTALEAFVNKVSSLEKDKYTKSSWDVFEAALNNANEVLANENALETEVNEAYDSLVRGFLDLRLIPNKDLLNDLINKAESLEAVNYTADTFNVMLNALEDAKAIAANENATQAEVDNAKDVLAKAIDGLKATSGVDNNITVPATDNKVTSVNNGDTTSIKTGDDSMAATLAGLTLLSIAGVSLLRKKED